MTDLQSDTSKFSVLFTAQKLKKHKTWQDGTITYYGLNRKIVLTDEKGYDIDRKFSRSGIPDVGDEIEFDMHIVTVESVLMGVTIYHQQPQPQPQQTSRNTAIAPTRSLPTTALENQTYSLAEKTSAADKDYRTARRRLQRSTIGSSQPNLKQPRIKPGSAAALYRTSNQQSEEMQTDQVSTNDQQPLQHPPIEIMPPSSLHLAPEPTISSYKPGQLSTKQHQTDDTLTAAQVPESPEISSSSTIPPKSRPANFNIRTTNSSIHKPSIATSHSPNTNAKALPISPPKSRQLFQPASLPPQQLEQSMQQSTRPLPDHRSSHPLHGTLDTTTSLAARSLLTLEADHTKRKIVNETNTGPPKRVRVGLSKRTGQPSPFIGTASTSLANNEPQGVNVSSRPKPQSNHNRDFGNTLSSSPATFMPASRVVVDEQDSSMASSSSSNSPSPSPSSNALTPSQPSKRFKVPFADGISVPLVLQFPTMERAMAVIKSKSLPKRTKVAPIQFTNASQYKDIFKRMIHEHLQIMLMNNALHFYSNLSAAKPDNLERHFRSKGLSFYQNCQLRSNNRSMNGSTFSLVVKNRESSFKYGKDDIWVISKALAFDASSTFLARSTFYGPSFNGTIDIECITSRDTRVASNMAMGSSPVFALRTISAGTEFMMIDSLEMSLDRLPLLPSILKSTKRKKQPELHKHKPAAIRLTLYDNIDISKKIDETTRFYNLNEDQESVLRAVAKSIIISPGWNEEAHEAITLVHGVFGSGKSFLAAVLIIFIREVVDSANRHREPDDQIDFRIMISCFTNVAVDRILTILVKLGYDEFVRIGSLKKIAKNLIPYTVKAKLSGNEELKELEQMLEDPQNSDEETDNIANAIQRFRKCENMLQLNKADVVGTTCSASCFEIFSDSTFPFILMDECSQVMEPLSMVPLTRFQSSKMVMIGDPKQLPPTVATQADENNPGLGLDKSLFSRLIEMGTQAIMLRTQYRCHPRISGISNNLFYDRQLLDGANVESRPPLINGLPPLMFVNVMGNEQRSIGNSFWNHDEVKVAAQTLKGLSELGIPPSDIGVISLYKEQADKIQSHLTNNGEKATQNIQISTVDAFQGAEKEIIILSTVRTSSSGFIDKHPRVNVALTRARRHLIILGNENLLHTNQVWYKIMKECGDNSMPMHEFTRFISTLPSLNPATIS